jgi:hypothetical protein
MFIADGTRALRVLRGVVEHVINSAGGATPSNTTPVDVTSFP